MGSAGEAVYCTLLISDSYLPGATVLAHSLKDAGSKAKLVCLVTLDTLQSSTIDELKTLYDDVVPVPKIVNQTPANLSLMGRQDLISTFTKIALWRQTQYDQIVYIDADVVALRAPDELLQMDTTFAAVPDVGWPDCFNSGVMVLKPNMGDYYSLLALAQRGISFDGADQGLLNMHFRRWDRLSFGYNCTPSGNYQYVPAYRHFQSTISLIHFIGHDKPWVLGRDSKKAQGVYDELLGRWWAVYDKHYRAPMTSFTPGQATPPRPVQNQVYGERTSAGYGYSTIPMTREVPPPLQASVIITKPSLADQPDMAETIEKGQLEPSPTGEQPRIPAPAAEWDASRAPPPLASKPEAANLPTTQYEMSSDSTLFQPPASYPEPPKDMYYKIPETKPKANVRPPPIFPWESRQPKPTRVFPKAPSPPSPWHSEPVHEPRALSGGAATAEGSVTTPSATDAESPRVEETQPPTPTVAITSPNPWESYSRTNAWDEMPDIERYIQALQASRKGKVQVLINTAQQAEDVLSPGAAEPSQPRRPSFKVTDFPTEVERPSLPVTPAPVRRPTFWGEERDSAGELPPAEGVPKQEEWNPMKSLEELQKRQSAVLELGSPRQPRNIPKREMPESVSEGRSNDEKKTIRDTAPASIFAEPDFATVATGSAAKEDEKQVDPGDKVVEDVEAST